MSFATAAERRSRRVDRAATLRQRIGHLIPFYYWAVLPALAATLAVVVLPLMYSFGLSFWHYVLTDPRNVHFDGLANYAHALNDPTFRNSLGTTFVYGVGTVAVELVLGMAFALVVNTLTVGAGLVRTAMLVPVFMTPAVVAFMWRFMLHPDLGIVNYFLALVGLGHPVWLGDPRLALPSVMAVEIWRNTPFMFLVFLAGMQSLPSELFEAAAVDGASFWQRFRSLTLPLLMPLILVALIIRGMDALREFDTIFIMTGGGPGNATETIAISTYRYSFRNYDMGLGSAVSYVIFAVVFLFGIYFVRRMNRTRVD
ncbi:MAG TPA: sugar ABC transporter permease [Chloroflexota bacterium]|nr:sugar ABC transporter permease [Chloroflexota bacterium]